MFMESSCFPFLCDRDSILSVHNVGIRSDEVNYKEL